jgi:hypothetical protein
MKINSTVLLTLILLTLMMGAGSLSGFLGFNLGTSALKGVTTPDGRPINKLASARTNYVQQGELSLLKEENILKIVKSRIDSSSGPQKKVKNKDDEADDQDKKPNSLSDTQGISEDKPQPGFPIASESEGVTLTVQSAHYSGGDLLLKVKMQNKGNDSVRFLYSFLDVTDDKGRTLSAITEGLPAELSSKGAASTGTISIPTSLLDDVKSISLALTDYPAQKLKLQVSEIPVEK